MTRSRTVLILVVLAALGVLALLRLHALPSRAAPAVANTQEPAKDPVDSAPRLTPAEEAQAEVSTAADSRVAIFPPPEIEASPPKARKAKKPSFTIELRGTLVGTDDAGNEWPDLDGVITVFIGWDRGAWKFEIPFRHGAWSSSIDIPAPIEKLSVRRIMIDGRPALLQVPRGYLPLPANDPIEIRARMPQSSTLHVIDEATGHHLSGLTLVTPEPFPRSELNHPGVEFANRVIAANVSSPIHMDELLQSFEKRGWDPARGAVPFLIGTAGYAWARTGVHFRKGGEQKVSLERGGSLTVHLQGVDPEAHALLRLRESKEGPLSAEVLLHGQPEVEFDGLTPGDLQVTAEIGDYWKSPLVLGESFVSIQKDGHVHVDLAIESAPKFETASVNGVIRIAEAWFEGERIRPMIVFDLFDTPLAGFDDHQSYFPDQISEAMSKSDAMDGFHSFSMAFADLQVGKYEVTMHKLPFRVVLELPKEGRHDIEWILPPPIDVLIQTINDTTLENVKIDGFRWAPHRPGGLKYFEGEQAEYDEDREGYVIRSPEMEIDYVTRSWDYRASTGTIDLRGGLREFSVSLEPSCGILVELTELGTPVPFPYPWWGSLLNAEGKRASAISNNGDYERRITAHEPGPHTLVLPPVPGFAEIPDVKVEILDRQFTRHTVELVRE